MIMHYALPLLVGGLIGILLAVPFALYRLRQRRQAEDQMKLKHIITAASYAGYHRATLRRWKWPKAAQVVEGIQTEKRLLARRAHQLQAKLAQSAQPDVPDPFEDADRFLDSVIELGLRGDETTEEEADALVGPFLGQVAQSAELIHPSDLSDDLIKWGNDLFDWALIVVAFYKKLRDLGSSKEKWYLQV
jgi:hypothetical protein